MKLNRPILFLIGGLLLLYLAQSLQQEPLDWRETYSKDEKIPFASYILYDLLDDFFPDQDIFFAEKSFYESVDSADFSGSNWIIINSVVQPDPSDTRKMLQYVEAGNALLISAQFIGGPIADSLKLKHGFSLLNPETDTLHLALNFVKGDWALDKMVLYHYFSAYDTLQSTILGSARGGVHFLKIKRGEGFFLLHSVPRVFTNYQILKGRSLKYLSAVLAQLPMRRTIWDAYYKEGRIELKNPLRYIFNRSALHWAYLTGLITLVLFMIFAARRKQRIIPVITPPRNDTLDFVDTVARLYYQHGDHKDMLNKKITFFMEYLRSRLYINAPPFSEEFNHLLAAKSGMAPDEVKTFMDKLKAYGEQIYFGERDLLDANQEMEKFKEKIKKTLS